MKPMLFVLAVALLLNVPCFAGPEIRLGDEAALSGTWGWILIHQDGTWKDIPEEDLPQYIHLIKDMSWMDATLGGSTTFETEDVEELTPPAKAKTWEYSTWADEMTDVKAHIFISRDMLGTSSLRRLCIRYQESGSLEIWINWDRFLGVEDRHEMAWRLDKQPAVKESWFSSTDDRSTFYHDDEYWLLKRLADSKTMLARVTRHDGELITASFDTSGIVEFMEMLPALKDRMRDQQ